MKTDAVKEYLSTIPENHRKIFEELGEIVKETLPEAIEGKSYGMPAFIYKGKALMCFMLTKNHYGIYPMGNEVMQVLKKDLEKYEQTKGSIHFPLGKKFPKSLIQKILKVRMTRIDLQFK